MTPTQHCKACNKSGWSFILFRIGVIATDRRLAPAGADKVRVGPALIAGLTPATPAVKSRYVLRLLRKGYVHVYLDNPPKGMKHWLIYRVTDEGDIVAEDSAMFCQPDASIACSAPHHNPTGLKLLHIPRADEIDHLWIAFSANYWNDTLRERNKANPQVMRRIERGTCPANGFVPTAEALKSQVLECALPRMSIAGSIDHDFPFNSIASQVDHLAEHLQKAAASHPKTQGQELAIVLDDPVGIAAELNELRLRWNDLSLREIEKPENAWPLNSIGQLAGLKKTLLAGDLAQAFEQVSPLRTRDAFNASDYPDGTEWHLLSDADQQALIQNASSGNWLAAALKFPYRYAYEHEAGKLGRVIFPDHNGRARAWAQEQADNTWKDLTRELDTARRDAWLQHFHARMHDNYYQPLLQYETDWMNAVHDTATVDYFLNHFDEDDPNSLLGLYLVPSAGQTYTRESYLIHIPAPQSPALQERYLDVLNRPIVDTRSVPLRAMFANQKSVIRTVFDQVSGDPGTDAGQARDVTYYSLKGMQELAGPALQKFNWLNQSFAALSFGHQWALATAALNLTARSPLVNPALQAALDKLQHLFGFRQALDLIVKGALERKAPAIPVRLSMEVPVERLVARAGKHPVSGISRTRLKEILRKGTGKGRTSPKMRVTLLTDTDEIRAANGDLQALAAKPGADVRVREAATLAAQEAAGNRLALTEERFLTIFERQGRLGATAALALQAATSGASAARAIGLSMEGQLAFGCLVVQWIGLSNSLRTLKDARTAEQVRDAWYMVGSFGAGLLSGATEILQVAVRSQVMAGAVAAGVDAGSSAEAIGKMTKEALKRSGPLAGLRVFTNVTGGVCGAFAAVGAWSSMEEKAALGEKDLAIAYFTAMVAYAGTTITSALTAAGFGADYILVNKLGGETLQQVAAKITEYVRVERAVSEAGLVEESVLMEVGETTIEFGGVGLVLLGIAGVAQCYTAVMKRTPLEDWIGCTYFGKASDQKRFHDWKAECEALRVVLKQNDPEPTAATSAPAAPQSGKQE